MGVHCIKRHEWNRCHMYGLGIYLADMAQKSHRYVSQPRIGRNGQPTYRMIVCSVLGKAFQIEGHLRDRECMHDVVNARALCEDDIDQMIEPCAASRASYGVGASIAGLDGSVWGRVVALCPACSAASSLVVCPRLLSAAASLSLLLLLPSMRSDALLWIPMQVQTMGGRALCCCALIVAAVR